MGKRQQTCIRLIRVNKTFPKFELPTCMYYVLTGLKLQPDSIWISTKEKDSDSESDPKFPTPPYLVGWRMNLRSQPLTAHVVWKTPNPPNPASAADVAASLAGDVGTGTGLGGTKGTRALRPAPSLSSKPATTSPMSSQGQPLGHTKNRQHTDVLSNPRLEQQMLHVKSLNQPCDMRWMLCPFGPFLLIFDLIWFDTGLGGYKANWWRCTENQRVGRGRTHVCSSQTPEWRGFSFRYIGQRSRSISESWFVICTKQLNSRLK